MNEWISVGDETPSLDVYVLVTDGKYMWIDRLYYYGNYIIFIEDNCNSVTHWMNLPPIP